MSEPVLLAILFADRVITENSNKKGIIGTFDKFISPNFPASFPAWAIYVAVTNIIGNHTFRINLTHIETNTVVLPINATKIAMIADIGICESIDGPRTKMTPTSPMSNPTSCRIRSCSPRTFTATIETRTG